MSEPASPATPATPDSPSSPGQDRQATREWLETILDNYHRSQAPDASPAVELKEWSVRPASEEREGYLSEQLCLTVTYAVAGSTHHAHLLAKLLPQDPFSRAFVIETQFDLREIKFYLEIKPAVEQVERKYLTEEALGSPWAPELYYCKHREASESVLVLADMCQQGYKIQDLTEGLSPDQARSALVTLAKFHAATLVLHMKEKKPLQENFPYLMSVDQAVESFRCLVERGLPLLLKFLSRKDQPVVREGLQKYSGPRTEEVLRRVLSPSEKLNTLVHCDFWCNNLLFKEDGDTPQCCIIDWQMVLYGRPAIDVALLITTSLEPSHRRKYAPVLLNTYWEAFTNRLASYGIEKEEIKFTKEDLEADYKLAQAMSALVVVGSIDMALGTAAREERALQLLSDLINEAVI